MKTLEDILMLLKQTLAPPRPAVNGKTPPADLQEILHYRTAVHEAGHAIAAWNCTAIYRVERIELDMLGTGTTSYSIVHPVSAAGNWCRTVISLASAAAEMHLIGNAKTMPSEGDLKGARRFAQEAIAQGTKDPPWIIRPGPTQRFRSCFQKPLTKQEARLLGESYRKARQLVAFHERQLRSLVHTLILHREMDAAHLARTLGSRAYVHVLDAFNGGSFFPE